MPRGRRSVDQDLLDVLEATLTAAPRMDPVVQALEKLTSEISTTHFKAPPYDSDSEVGLFAKQFTNIADANS